LILDPKVHTLVESLGSKRSSAMTEIVEAPPEQVEAAPMWELAECTCPDWCERDHEQD
jgi:hypothetical protein